ncbi:MAG: leucine-rich repeat protein [Christensenellaceae bacterium]|nr:leucine-rich repeat protein [Christensenellaceae bacterium]
MKRLKIKHLIILVLCGLLLTIILSSCDSNTNGPTNQGNVPTFVGITARRVAKAGREEIEESDTICLDVEDGKVETLIITVNLLNSSGLEITSLVVNEKTYSYSNALSDGFFIADNNTKLTLEYTPQVTTGEVSIALSNIYYKKNNKVEQVQIKAKNSINAIIDPNYTYTLNIWEASHIGEGGELVDAQWVSVTNPIGYMDRLNSENGVYTEAQMSYIENNLLSLGYCKEGYGFAGWFSQENGGGFEVKYNAYYTFNYDLTLYAHYENLYNYVVKTDSDGVEYAEIISVTATARRIAYNTLSREEGLFADELTIFNNIDGYPVRTIGAKAFYDELLLGVRINYGILEIGESAFENFQGNITFYRLNPPFENPMLRYIGKRAFANWHYALGTQYFFIPDTVEHIGEEAFLGTGWHTRLSYVSNVADNNGSITRTSSLFIPNSVKRIEKGAFKNSTFEKIYFMADPALEFLGDEVFANSTNLTTLFTSVIIASANFVYAGDSYTGISEIPSSAFEGCFVNAKTVTADLRFHEGLLKIGNRAFFSIATQSVQELTFPDSLTDIGESAFANMTKLTQITFGDNSSLRNIGAYAFLASQVKEVDIKSVHLISYGASPFMYNLSLRTVYFSATTPPIFRDPTSIQGLTANYVKYIVPDATAYKQSGKGWSAQRVYSKNMVSTRDASTLASYGFEEIVGGVRIVYISEINVRESAVIVIPQTIRVEINGELFDKRVLEIGEYVASNNIEELRLPLTIKKIGQKAFIGCAKLAKIGLGNFGEMNDGFRHLSSLEEIGAEAFSGTKISKFIAPRNIKLIGNKAFANIATLLTIYVNPEESAIIDTEAFSRCGVTTVYLGMKVNILGDASFSYCSNLTDVYIYRSYPPSVPASAILGPFYGSDQNNNFALHIPLSATSTFTQAQYFDDFKYTETSDPIPAPETL